MEIAMGDKTTVVSSDGFELDAWLAVPEGTPKGGVLVIQEIFGVNAHIREVVDGYAADGYAALAPALFDRAERGVELGYEGDDFGKGAGLAFNELKMPTTIRDLMASVEVLAHYGNVGVVGYCYGGLMAYLSACNIDSLSCSVGYYGGGIANQLAHRPRIPLMLHFGEQDAHIPMADVAKIKEVIPDAFVHTYDADHGFNCNHRASYSEPAARQAKERTLAFFATHIG